MSISEINSYSSQITSIISQKTDNKKLKSKKIQNIIQEADKKISKYYASKPASPEEIDCLIHFEIKIKDIHKRISGLAGSRIVKTIDRISTLDPNKAYFFHEGKKNRIGLTLEKLKDFLAGKIRNCVRREIFYTWNQKNRYLNSLKKVEQLRQKISLLESKFGKNPKNEKIKIDLDRTKLSIERIEKFIKEYEKNLKSGENTRTQLSAIGGLRIEIETQDHKVLDAFYLSADNFYKKCCEANALKAAIKTSKGSSDIQGLLFSKNENADKFLKTLDDFKLFANPSDPTAKNSGWIKISLGDKTAIIPDVHLKTLLDEKLLEEIDGTYTLQDLSVLTESPLSYDPRASGTIILGMGAAGVYEMYKRETIALLMQGVNVMLYNQRGHGQSTGTPSETGTYEDIEAVYQYLKQTHHQVDEKLVIKGLCLSGGIAAHLAANHPKINIILDQTYAEISDIALNTVLDSVKDIIHYNPEDKKKVKKAILASLTPILKIFVRLVTPDYKIKHHLNKVQGKILILRATEDTYTPITMTHKIIDSYIENKQSGNNPLQIQVGHMPGIHGSSWLDSKTKEGDSLGKLHIFSFLHEAQISNPYLDDNQTLKVISKEHSDLLANTLVSLINDPLEVKRPPPQCLLLTAYKDLKYLLKNSIVISKPLKNVKDGKMRFTNVLSALDRLKDQLGGSPVFKNSQPLIDDKNNRIKIFGLSKSVIQMRLTVILKKEWKPDFFWSALAKLFGVRKNNLLSNYEESHLSIQKFGMLIANKERILKILKNKQRDKYDEFSQITGLAWHPNNEYGVEKAYIEFIEYVFTDYFEELQKQGDDLLIEFFKTLNGVCFENRVRSIEAFVQAHPLSSSSTLLDNIADWDTSSPVEKAFLKELTIHGLHCENITRHTLLDHLKEKGIFDLEFPKGNQRIKPTELDYHKWAFELVNDFIIEAYPLKEFLDIQLEIFKQSGQKATLEAFQAFLLDQSGKNDGFDPNSEDTRAYLNNLKDQGLFTEQ